MRGRHNNVVASSPKLTLRDLFVIALSLTASQFASAAPTDSDRSVHHLVPVNENEAREYQTELQRRLSITPADVARMIVCPSWLPEYAVSVHSQGPFSADDVAKYYVTVTRASTNIWSARQPVEVRRLDAELAASTALAVKEAWREMLLTTRPYEQPIDSSVDGEIVEFALAQPSRPPLRGELPENPASDVLTLEKLGNLLVKYCEVPPNERAELSKEIEKAAKRLLNKKPERRVAELKDSVRIPAHERHILKRKAKQGDANAADRLSTYYGVFRNDKKMQLRYLTLGAENNSDVAVRNLMTLYSTDSDLFDFKKALALREKLKKMATEKRDINLKSDADWAYDRYVDNFKAAGNKWEGVLFLEYAAKQASEKARIELIDIYSNDPEVKDPARATYWKKKFRLRSDNASVPDATTVRR